jgi:hypothetical protein
MTTPFGTDGTNCDPKNTEKPCDNLYGRVMNGQDPKAVKADAKSDAPQPQVIQVNIVVSQPEQVRDPAHLKVHHNPFSIVARAVGHYGKEYALGVRDSVKPRNLGMATLPIALNEYNAIRIGQGLKQLGQGEEQLAAGEQQLGAGLTQIGQQLGALEGAGAAARAGAMARVGATAKIGTVAAHAEVTAAPKLATGASQIAGAIPGEGVASASPRIAAVSATGETAIATPAGAVQLPNGGIMNIAVTTSGGAGGRPAELQAAANPGTPLTIDNRVKFLPNEGFNANGDIVAMTPKQMAQAQEFASKSGLEETHLTGAMAQYNTELADVQKAMSTSKNAPAWFKMLDQRMTYFNGTDKQGDHQAARAWLSDAGQCVDYLKRDAQSTHNEDAIRKLEALKRSVKELDAIEKKFGKTPDVILPA